MRSFTILVADPYGKSTMVKPKYTMVYYGKLWYTMVLRNSIMVQRIVTMVYPGTTMILWYVLVHCNIHHGLAMLLIREQGLGHEETQMLQMYTHKLLMQHVGN